MIIPKYQTEGLLLSNTKNCELLIHQTRSRPEETLQFEVTKPRQTFHFSPISMEESAIL